MPRSRRTGRLRGSLLALALLAPVLLGAAPGGSGETISLAGNEPGERLDVTLTRVVDPADPAGQEPTGNERLVATRFRLENTGTAVYQDSPRRPRTCWTPTGGGSPATTSPPPRGRTSPRPSPSTPEVRRRASSPSGCRGTPTRPRSSSPSMPASPTTSGTGACRSRNGRVSAAPLTALVQTNSFRHAQRTRTRPAPRIRKGSPCAAACSAGWPSPPAPSPC